MKKGKKVVVLILLIVTILMIGQMGKSTKENKTNEIQIGDYVAYDPTFGVADQSKLTYASPVGTGLYHGNGDKYIEEKQTFTANNNIKWRIFNKDEETGEIMLISETPIQMDNKGDFSMYGAIGYLYAEQELNEICNIYGYGKGANIEKVFQYKIGDMIEGERISEMQGSGARSITVEDINKVTKFNPNVFAFENANLAYKYGDSYTHSIYYPTMKTKTGKSEEAKERKETFTAYRYEALKDTANASNRKYKVLFGNGEMCYWIASRGIDIYSDETNFDVFIVNDGTVDVNSLCSANSIKLKEGGGELPIRPIVYLQSNIHFTKRDENGAWIIDE